jgi:hypothetical protein
MRGLAKVRGERTFVWLCHSLIKLVTGEPALATA